MGNEEERLKIAEKFQDVLENTGACILRQPTLERAIISFIIYLFEQIVKKFLATHNSDITVVIPSGSSVNTLIADTIKRYKKDTSIVNDLLRKLTVEEV